MIIVKTHEDIEKLRFEDIDSVYSGKAGRCCCGCSGTHWYPKRNFGEGKALRGYDIGLDECSDRAVKVALGKVKRAARETPGLVTICFQEYSGGDHIAYETKNRLTILYFNQSKRRD